MARQFERLQSTYGFEMIDGDRSPEEINASLQRKTEAVMTARRERAA
jgi:hypothetical protein